MAQIRINCVMVTINEDLSTSYRLTLPLRPQDQDLIYNQERIKITERPGKAPLYHYVFESTNANLVMQHKVCVQSVINSRKIQELQAKDEALKSSLITLHNQVNN